MSSKAKKMSENITPKEAPTKSAQYRIDVDLSGVGLRTTYMVVTGIPEDLPDEMEPSVRAAAEKQFASVIKAGSGYLEFYSEGKTSADEQPVFYNLFKLDWLSIKSVTKVN